MTGLEKQNLGWRPDSRIRLKAIGLAKREGRLLVCEVRDDANLLKGWIPPGGGVEFGETAEAALRREIREELGIECAVCGAPTIFENLYEHEGAKGHEIVFAFPIMIPDPGISAKQRFLYLESDGNHHFAEWIEIERFHDGTETLFPSGIGALLA
ncbi:MAG: NUDIX hydrolase [Rhodospirillaceae bacterium]